MSPRRPPPPRPEFFVDRSLGSRTVPEAIAARGFTVHTLASVYGEQAGQHVDDIVWLTDAGRHDWVVLHKDDRIRRRPAELEPLMAAGLRVFSITNANLTGAQMAELVTANLNRIVQRARKPGPYVYGIYQDGLRRLWPPA